MRRRGCTVGRDKVCERGGTADGRVRCGTPGHQQAAGAGDKRRGGGAVVNARGLANAVQHQIGHRIGHRKTQVQHRPIARCHRRVGPQRRLHQPQRARADRRVAGVAVAPGERQRAAAELGQTAARAVRILQQRQPVRDVVADGVNERTTSLHKVGCVDGRRVRVEQEAAGTRRQRPAVEVKNRSDTTQGDRRHVCQ